MSVTRCLRAHVKKAGLEPLPSLAVVVFWAHNMYPPIRILSNQSFLPHIFNHLLLSVYKTLFSTHFPTQHFHVASWVDQFSSIICKAVLLSSLSCCNRWSLLGWIVSVCVLQHSHFLDNGPVTAQDWVGESSGGRIRHCRLVCDLCSHVKQPSVLIVYLSHYHYVHISLRQWLHS